MSNMVTYLGIIVSALSVLVVVLIGWQIVSLRMLEKYRKEIKSIVDNSIQESIKDYNCTVSAIIHQIEGIFYMGLPEKDLDRALDAFIEAIDNLNNAKNKEPIGGLVDYLEQLLSENQNLLKVSNNTKNKYIDICKKSTESEKIMNLLDKLNTSQNQYNTNGDNIYGKDVTVNK